jgi:hypothetical protein
MDVFDPIFSNVSRDRRSTLQGFLGKHIVSQRDRMANIARAWVKGDQPHPMPIHERVLARIRALDPSTRSDVWYVALLVSDAVSGAVMATFDAPDYFLVEGRRVNYAIVAQMLDADAEVIEQVDLNRGSPVIALWDAYRKWVSRYGTVLRRDESTAPPREP